MKEKLNKKEQHKSYTIYNIHYYYISIGPSYTPLFNTTTYPPLAITVCVPIMTLLTVDIIAKTAESGMTVVSIPATARLLARS